MSTMILALFGCAMFGVIGWFCWLYSEGRKRLRIFWLCWIGFWLAPIAFRTLAVVIFGEV